MFFRALTSKLSEHPFIYVALLVCAALAHPLAAPSETTADNSPTPAVNLHQWGAVTLFHGLPSDRVRAIAQDADGTMWFGTDAGLARYDGRRTQTVVEAGLGARRIHALRFDARGRLWIGTDAGAVVRLAGGAFQRIGETEGKTVAAIAVGEETTQGAEAAQGAETGQGATRVVLATNAGVVFDCRAGADDALEVRAVEDRLLLGPGADTRAPLELTSALLDGERLLLGTRGRGLLAVEGGAVKEVLSKPRAFFVEAIERDARGGLWFGAQTTSGDSGLYDGASNILRPQKIAAGGTGTVTALTFDERGDLLVGTEGEGVFRYRGRTRLERFTFEGTAGGLRSDRIYSIFIDREGVAWFGTDRGVCRYDPHGLRNESLSTDAQSNFVRALFQTADGRLLAGTNRGLFVREPASLNDTATPAAWHAIPGFEDKSVYALAEDRDGLLLVGTSSGLYTGLERRREAASTGGNRDGREAKPLGATQAVKSPDAQPVKSNEAARPLKSVEALRPATEAEAAPRAEEQEAKSPASKQAARRAGANRAGSESKAGAMRASKTTDETGASAESRKRTGADARQEATSRAEEQTADEPAQAANEPAVTGSLRAIASFQKAIYMASYGRGLEKLERAEGRLRSTLVWPSDATGDPRMREVVSLYADEEGGRLWIGTANAGVFFFDGKEVRNEAALAPLDRSAVRAISGGRLGQQGAALWFATGHGLYLYRAGALQDVAPNVDARGVVHIGDATGSQLQALCATAGGGLLKVSVDEVFGVMVARLDAEQGLPSQNVFAVLPLREAQANVAPADATPDATEQGATVTRRESVRGTTRGSRALLIGTSRGISRYEPGDAPPALRATRITGARAYQTDELRDGLRLEYPQNSLVLDVAATSSRTFPEQFQYAFLLYNEAGQVIKRKLAHDSQLQIEDLRPGNYRVEARAYNADLVASMPLAFNLYVARAPFPWTTSALSVLLALALVALVWGSVQNTRLTRAGTALMDANRQLAAARLQLANEAETERRRIARDLHDQTLADLRRLLLLTDKLQANNNCKLQETSAAKIQENGAGGVGVVEQEALDPAVLRAEIESISNEIRRICEDLSPSVLENVGFAAALEWALTERVAHLPADCRFQYEFVREDDLDERLSFTPGVQMQIYRIVQEAVSNVCRHAEATRVRMTIDVNDAGDFILTLEDDGRGFDPANKRARLGRGLANIRARASIIDAEVTWHKRPAEEGGGIVFTLRKPNAGAPPAPPAQTLLDDPARSPSLQ